MLIACEAGGPTVIAMTIDRRRALIVDTMLAIIVGLIMLIGSARLAELEGLHPVTGFGVVVIVAAAGSVAIRRLWPLAALIVTVVSMSAWVFAGYSYGPILFGVALVMFIAGLKLPMKQSAVGCGAGTVLVIVSSLLAGGSVPMRLESFQPSAIVAWLIIPWALGLVLRLRREAQARAIEEERNERRYTERLQIAREVHDVVGHGLAVINMQAGIALHVLDKRPEQAAVALEAIKQASKDSLEELRATLALYRQADEPRHPAAGLRQLDDLVATTVASGLSVKVETDGTPAELPATVDHAAYRIIQESLTNVLRHAGAASAEVLVTYEPDAVSITVTDDGRKFSAGSAGHGIQGMRERAAAMGGTLDAGPRTDGGFAVRARLPIGQ